MTKREFECIDPNGQIIMSVDGIIPDGCRVRMPLHLMDSVQREVAAQSPTQIRDAWGAPAGHRPGYVFSSAPPGPRVKAFFNEGKRLQDAWRNPSGVSN